MKKVKSSIGDDYKIEGSSIDAVQNAVLLDLSLLLISALIFGLVERGEHAGLLAVREFRTGISPLSFSISAPDNICGTGISAG